MWVAMVGHDGVLIGAPREVPNNEFLLDAGATTDGVVFWGFSEDPDTAVEQAQAFQREVGA